MAAFYAFKKTGFSLVSSPCLCNKIICFAVSTFRARFIDNRPHTGLLVMNNANLDIFGYFFRRNYTYFFLAYITAFKAGKSLYFLYKNYSTFRTKVHDFILAFKTLKTL